MANKKLADASRASVKLQMPGRGIRHLPVMLRLHRLYDLHDRELDEMGSL